MSVQKSSKWGVPAHITGLFQIVVNENPLQMGSRGAGFNLANKIITNVQLKQSTNREIRVFFNDIEIDGKVSIAVANNFLKEQDESSLEIFHHSDFPMQAGFGTSGAGAIGTAFAMNEIMNTNKSAQELGQIAHRAEVDNRTGLGDVIAQMFGGAEIRLEPGAPGIGIIKKLDWPIEQMILTASLGTLSTKDIITSEEMIQKINDFSEKLLIELNVNPTLEEFLRVSYEFASKTGLLSGKLKELVDHLRNEGYFASMIMLGQSLFVVGEQDELVECGRIIENNVPKTKIWISTLSNKGPVKLEH